MQHPRATCCNNLSSEESFINFNSTVSHKMPDRQCYKCGKKEMKVLPSKDRAKVGPTYQKYYLARLSFAPIYSLDF